MSLDPPRVTDADVRAIVERDFPSSQRTTVYERLLTCGTEPHHRDNDRVRMAVLKLSGGDLNKLEETLRTALLDYRDVLAWAEEPRFCRAGFSLSDEARQRLQQEDRAEYEAWLGKPTR
jgi:hypothetical protein